MLPFLKFTILNNNVVIPMYNLMIGIGLILGILIFQKTCENKKIKKTEIDNLMVVACFSLLSSFLFAALFDKVVHYHSPKAIIAHLFEFTGLTFAGGLFGGVLTFIVLYRIVMKNYKNFILHANCAAPSVALGHCFGRIGCFCGGCCFGRPTHSIIGIAFPNGSFADQLYGNGVKVIPTQLMEAFFLLGLFLLIYFIFSDHAFECYLIFYGIFRFIIEFFRGDSRGTLFQTIISPSQCLSAIMIFAGIFIFLRNFAHMKKIYNE